MNKEFYKMLDRAIAAASKHEKDLLSYPGVIAVGAGPRRKGGKITGEAAIVVTVRRKEEQPEGRALPAELDGIRVDVVAEGKPVEAPEIVEAQERAKTVLEQVREKWLSTPNVTGIGISYKRVNGEMDFNRIALTVFVEQKLSVAELRKRKLEAVPKEIDGVLTDVQVMPRMGPAGASGSRDDRKDPLVGGLTVGVNTKPFWYGTLGSIVFDRTTGEQMVLSNQHVLDGAPGTEVVQPSPIGLDDSLEIGFQLDICNPLHFFRLDTPNTTVGSVLAGAAVAAVVAAALSDEIDPTRRGQEATVPPAGAKTLQERQRVRLSYPELPVPGKHFAVKTEWEYTRETDAGNFSHVVSEAKVNPHALADKLLLTDRKLYHPGETIRLFGMILPEACAPTRSDANQGKVLTKAEIRRMTTWSGRTPDTLGRAATSPLAAVAVEGCRCDRYQVTAILWPTTVDRAFPVVLRQPVVKLRGQLLTELLQLVQHLDDKELLARVFRLARYGCLYTGELSVGSIPMGPWKQLMYVQTVNFATENMKPTQAAQIIGGLPVSNNTRPTLDVACGPLTIDDGQFEIELL